MLTSRPALAAYGEERPTASYLGHDREFGIIIKRPTNAFSVRPVSFDGQILHGGTFTREIYTQQGFVKPFFVAHYFDLFANLANTLYIGPFRNVLNLAGNAASYFDIIIGSVLIGNWNSMKNGTDPLMWERVAEITDLFKRIFEYRDLDISANHDRNDFLIRTDGKRYPLSAMGAGFAQFLIIFANLISKKPSLILIDEPELNLHPALQADFVTTLRSFASEGVLFATHSVGLARAVAERIYSVRRVGIGRSEVHPWERTPRLAEFIGEMGFTAYQDLGFEKLLLVEGPTEVKTVQQVLRMMGKDHKVVVFPLGGDGMITGGRDLELEEAKRITSNVFVLIDSEREAAGESLKPGRRDFIKSCAKASIAYHVTDRRATENYFTDAAVKKAKSPKYRALGPYERLADAPEPKWGKSENWLIAREMTADDWRANDVGSFLDGV
jgi:energy-coupling factor transporter ATP-binding protein EcfA2